MRDSLLCAVLENSFNGKRERKEELFVGFPESAPRRILSRSAAKYSYDLTLVSIPRDAKKRQMDDEVGEAEA